MLLQGVQHIHGLLLDGQRIVAMVGDPRPGDALHVGVRELQNNAAPAQMVASGALDDAHGHQQKDILQELVVVDVLLERDLAAHGLGVLRPVRDHLPVVDAAG